FPSQALGLIFEVIAGILQVVAQIFDAAAQFAASHGAGLRRAKNGGSAADDESQTERYPKRTLTHSLPPKLHCLLDSARWWRVGLGNATQSRPASCRARMKMRRSIARLSLPVFVLRSDG